MTQFDMRSIRKAPAAQISSKAESRKLFEGAETAANEHLAVPYSPIVLAGTVRMIELTLVALVGFAVYVAYVLPHDGFEWYYVGAIIGVAILALLAFQIADIYQVQAFRGHEKIFPSRLRLVGGVPDRDRRFVFRQGRRPILPCLARQLLRHRPVTFWRSAGACSSSCGAGRVKGG